MSEEHSPPNHTSEFYVVLNHELDQIAARREAVLGESTENNKCPGCNVEHEGTRETNACIECVRDRAKRMDLFGVSFSGGGIRSATLCLGVLQALGKLKLLKQVDYLSTVSGGGYIGGWLAAWIRRETDGLAAEPFSKIDGATAIKNIEQQLDPDRVVQARSERRQNTKVDVKRPPLAEDAEPSPIYHVRAHSRFLAPRGGILSLDRWALLAIYARNLFVNSLIVLPLIAFLVLFVRLVVRAYSSSDSLTGTASWLAVAGFAVAILIGQTIMRVGLNPFRSTEKLPEPSKKYWDPARIGLLLLAAGVLMIWLTAPVPSNEASNRMPRVFVPKGGLTDYVVSSGIFAVVGLAVGLMNWTFRKTFGSPVTRLIYVVCLIVYGVVFGGLLVAIVNEFLYFDQQSHPALFATFGPPVFLVAIILAGFSEIAVAGGWYSEYEREWRSRLTAWLLIIAAGWTVLFGTVIYLPQLLDNKGGTASVAAVAAISAILRFLIPKLATQPSVLMWMVVRVVPVIFLIAMLALVASGVDRLIAYRDREPMDPYITIPFQAVGGGTLASMTDEMRSSIRPDEASRLKAFAAIAGTPALAARIESGRVSLPESPYFFQALPRPSFSWTYAERFEQNSFKSILVGVGIAAFLFGIFIFIVPVNRFSLHSLYANRLIRCYLGASLRDANADNFNVATAVKELREANKFSGFDPNDDMPLVQLRCAILTTSKELDATKEPVKAKEPDATKEPGDTTTPYYGPYPLFNTTLNMVENTELAFLDRRGESFVLTPDYCGSDSTGYGLLNGGNSRTDERLTDQHGKFWNLTVGRAITISGAAVDPNMANYYSVQFTAFLTILNARLGWWIENPKSLVTEPDWIQRKWLSVKSFIDNSVGNTETFNVGCIHDKYRDKKNAIKNCLRCKKNTTWEAKPPFGSRHYVKELLGWTDAKQSNVHLSDGGHYENTGAYELIRRRCRFVLLVDAAENPDNTSENLANLIRLVHTDFGIRIQIDTTPLKRGPDGRTQWHCAIGTIRYDEIDEGGVIGTLLFVRSSLSGDEPSDIKNFANVTPVFPHHPTSDQFFDEAQFESYRGLGFHIGINVLGEAAESTHKHANVGKFNRQLFSRLRRQWTPCSTAQSEKYLESCGEFMKFIAGSDQRAHQRELAADLVGVMSAGLPNVSTVRVPSEGDDERAQDRRMQLMEMVWQLNDLSQNYTHPIQRGWISTMRRWTSMPDFQKNWPLVRSEYSREFVRFCERALNVNQPSILLDPIKGAPTHHHDDWIAMQREFGQENLSYFQKNDSTKKPIWGGKYDEYLQAVANKNAANFWLIGYGDPDQKDEMLPKPAPDRLKHIIGVVAIFNPILNPAKRKDSKPNPKELLLWVRGQYRMSGVGSVVLRLLKEEGKLKDKLIARLPRSGSGHAEHMQRAMWVQFMNDFDFYGVPSTGADWEGREIRVQSDRTAESREQSPDITIDRNPS